MSVGHHSRKLDGRADGQTLFFALSPLPLIAVVHSKAFDSSLVILNEQRNYTYVVPRKGIAFLHRRLPLQPRNHATFLNINDIFLLSTIPNLSG